MNAKIESICPCGSTFRVEGKRISDIVPVFREWMHRHNVCRSPYVSFGNKVHDAIRGLTTTDSEDRLAAVLNRPDDDNPGKAASDACLRDLKENGIVEVQLPPSCEPITV